jgi:hypothetical protein
MPLQGSPAALISLVALLPGSAVPPPELSPPRPWGGNPSGRGVHYTPHRRGRTHLLHSAQGLDMPPDDHSSRGLRGDLPSSEPTGSTPRPVGAVLWAFAVVWPDIHGIVGQTRDNELACLRPLRRPDRVRAERLKGQIESWPLPHGTHCQPLRDAWRRPAPTGTARLLLLDSTAPPAPLLRAQVHQGGSPNRVLGAAVGSDVGQKPHIGSPPLRPTSRSKG